MKDISQLSDKELLALAKSQGIIKNSTTVKEDIKNLGHNIYEIAKNLPGTSKRYIESASKNPGQTLAGLIPGVSSILDIPALAGNAAMWPGQYIAQKVTGNNDIKTPSIEYYGHDMGSKLADILAGIPQSSGEQEARTTGELITAPLNPAKLAKAPLSMIGKGVGKATSFNPTKYKMFEEAGLQPRIGDVSDSVFVKRLNNAVEQLPLGNLRVGQREAKLANNFEDLSPVSLESTGELTSKGATGYNNKIKAAANKLYEKAWQGIDQKSSVDLSDTLSEISNAFEAITPEAREILENTTGGKILKEIQNDILKNKGTLPFKDLKEVYKYKIDDLIDSWGQVGKSDQGKLKRVYNSINQDMNKFVLQHNPEALEDLKIADKFWANYSDKNRGIANKFIDQKSDIASFNQIKNSLEKGETRQAKLVLQGLSSTEKKDLTHTLIFEQGKNAEGEFNPYKWANNFNKMPKESKVVYLSGLPLGDSTKLRRIAGALGNVKETAKHGNPSGSAYSGAVIGTLISVVSSPVIAAKTLGAPLIAGELFSNPKIIDALYNATKVKTAKEATRVIDKYKPIIAKEIDILVNQNQDDNSTVEDITKLSDEELLKLYQGYKKGGHVESHYTSLEEAIKTIASVPAHKMQLGTISSWLKDFSKRHNLLQDANFKKAYNYLDKIKTKSQIPILLNYMHEIPSISKKKMFNIRKSYVNNLK